MAAAVAPLGLPINSQFFRPTVKGRMARSAALLSIWILPSVKNKVSHRITELKWNGDDVCGKALILNTPMGQIVKGLLDGGVKLGVSSRGMGSVESRNGKTYVKEDFSLATVDIVQDPSAPSAFVEGIMEGVEFFKEGNEIVARKIEKIKKTISRTSKSQLAEAQEREFMKFMTEIANGL